MDPQKLPRAVWDDDPPQPPPQTSTTCSERFIIWVLVILNLMLLPMWIEIVKYLFR